MGPSRLGAAFRLRGSFYFVIWLIFVLQSPLVDLVLVGKIDLGSRVLDLLLYFAVVDSTIALVAAVVS
jgi:hypothetical protein